MKNGYIKLMLLVLVIPATVLAFACPRPKSTTVTATCQRLPNGTWNCPNVGVTVVFDRQVLEIDEGTALIVDVPSGWSADLPTTSLEFRSNYETPQADDFTIPLTLTTSTLDPIDTGSSVHTLVGGETIIQAAKNSQLSETESRFTSQIAVTQISCDLPAGEYTFHYRSQNRENVTYLGAVTIVYEVTTVGSCVGNSAELKN